MARSRRGSTVEWTTDGAGASESTNSDSDLEVPDAVAQTRFLPGGFMDGELRNTPDIAVGSETAVPTGGFARWELPSVGEIAVYEAKEYADDGYPLVVAKKINPIDGGPYWKQTHIAETWADAVEAAERVADHETFLADSEPAEAYDEWVDRTGGTDYERPLLPGEDSSAGGDTDDGGPSTVAGGRE